MNVGLLAPEVLTVGGVQTYMRRLLEVLGHFTKEGDTAFCLSVNDDSGKVFQQNGVQIFGAGRSKVKYLILALKHAKKANYLLVGHIGQAPIAWLLKQLGLIERYGVILHGIEAWERLPMLKRLALRDADGVIATTHYTAEKCAEKNGLKNNKLSIIPLCVKALDLEPSDFKLMGEFKILCVGRQAKTEAGKGYHMLFDAMTKIINDYPSVHLNMVGKGDGQQHLIKRSRKLGLENYVTFWGGLSGSDLQAAYKDCDVFAMPSKKEGFGIVFLEAMYWGKPCIGGNHGGTPEVIQEGKSGFLIDFDDTDRLVSRIGSLIRGPEVSKKYGDYGRKLVETKFSFQVFCASFKKLLKTCAFQND